MSGIPKNMQEWTEFTKDFTDANSAVVLGAVGEHIKAPLAACTGGYVPATICIAAVIRNLADNVDMHYDDVLDDVARILQAVEDSDHE